MKVKKQSRIFEEPLICKILFSVSNFLEWVASKVDRIYIKERRKAYKKHRLYWAKQMGV